MNVAETGGVAEDRSLVTAPRLMRMALPLLDRSGRHLVAARLQHAIDGAQAACPDVVSGEE